MSVLLLESAAIRPAIGCPAMRIEIRGGRGKVLAALNLPDEYVELDDGVEALEIGTVSWPWWNGLTGRLRRNHGRGPMILGTKVRIYIEADESG